MLAYFLIGAGAVLLGAEKLFPKNSEKTAHGVTPKSVVPEVEEQRTPHGAANEFIAGTTEEKKDVLENCRQDCTGGTGHDLAERQVSVDGQNPVLESSDSTAAENEKEQGGE